jgi:hypothetical protein
MEKLTDEENGFHEDTKPMLFRHKCAEKLLSGRLSSRKLAQEQLYDHEGNHFRRSGLMRQA